MKKLLLVFGTRPEAIKMCPLVNELKTRSQLNTVVCVTGQHRQMLDPVLRAFGVVPDYDLAIMREGQDLFDITAAVLEGLRPVLAAEQPELLLVHGDTTTTFAAALAGFYRQIPIGHVEAGLRTHDLRAPFPEEFNREAVGLLARYSFAPTEAARDNLLREGRDPASVFVTGNTVVDALRTTVRADYSHPALEWAEGSRLVFLTAHRRESLGEPMARIFRAVRRVVDAHPDVKVLYPVHLNPAVREAARRELSGCGRIRLCDPLDVRDCHNLMARSHLILTDSGGVQEEAAALGKPVLILRDATDRPEGVAAGSLKLVGTDEAAITREFSRLLTDEAACRAMARAANPYGDGRACTRIADILERGYARS